MRPATLNPTDCVNLDMKIREALQRKDTAHGPVRKCLHFDAFDDSEDPSNGVEIPTLSSVKSLHVQPPGSIFPPPPKRISLGLAKFPGPQLQHVCDLAPGREKLLHARKTDALLQAFRHAFPGYQPAIATVYRYRNTFLMAKKVPEILGKYIAFGQTSEGEWAKLKKGTVFVFIDFLLLLNCSTEIQTLQKQGSIPNGDLSTLTLPPKPALQHNQPVREKITAESEGLDSSDDEFDYDVFPFLRESFQYQDGVLVSHIQNLNDTAQAVFFLKPLFKGQFRNVHYVCYSLLHLYLFQYILLCFRSSMVLHPTSFK